MSALSRVAASVLAVGLCVGVGRGGEEDGAFVPRVTSTKPTGVPADWTEPPKFPDGFAAAEKLGPYVAVNREKGEVMVAVALSNGMGGLQSELEFLLISGERNLDGFYMYERAYESIFTTRARPDAISVLCLLAGLAPGEPPRPIPEEGVMDNAGRVEGEEVKPEAGVPATRVVLTVEWEADGAHKTARAEDFLYDRGAGRRVARTPWLFTGSYFVMHPARGRTLASSLTQVVAATFYDRSALFNLPYFSANTYRDVDAGIVMDSESLPADFRYRETIIEGIERRRIWQPLQRRAFLRIRKATPEEARLPDEDATPAGAAAPAGAVPEGGNAAP